MTASVPGAPPGPGGPGTRRPDPERWPDVAEVPRCGPARAVLAELFVRRAVARLPLCVTLPDGRTRGRGGPRLELRDPAAFHRRIAVDGLIGFGESYQAGEWEAPDLVAVLTVLAAEVRTLVPPPLQRLRRMYVRQRPVAQRNTARGARDNVHRHYDLSNDLFASFLDPGMSYSAAVFRSLPASPSHLWAAQQRKVDRLLDLARVGPGSRLLEIGTGWGELALRAAERGAEVVTITLSEEQRRYAQRRVAEASPPGRVDVLLRDYREVTGHYDAIVSVEMIEAVGAEFWPEFLRVLDRRLAPDGRVALQAITMPHDRMLATRDTYTWIQKYVFPGGMLPSEEAVARISAERTSLRLTRSDGFGPHYAETLRLWRERFTARTRHVRRLGFDETFQRMWTFYLGYSEAGFRSGYLDVRQLLLEKSPLPEEGESST